MEQPNNQPDKPVADPHKTKLDGQEGSLRLSGHTAQKQAINVAR